ncbi:AF1514 family protein [Sedimenticola sp.]|uniref:AF1514 family protein n=1 Tax=Sedimenticola sp. TaxID=1940285 RepID=UPI003D150286
MDDPHSDSICHLPTEPDYSGVTLVTLEPDKAPQDYQEAMQLANQEAQRRLGEHMLLSWYDRDRDFESPQHASECHQRSAIPGYVDYALYRHATLRIDFQQGRFVFFYLPVDL